MYDLTKILPHKPPMILLDDIVKIDIENGKLISLFKVRPEKMFFEIRENDEIVKCTMVDERIEIEVPNTGLKGFDIINPISLVLLCLGIGVVAYAIKKKRKQAQKGTQEEAKKEAQEKAWSKMISYIESMISESTPTISLENGDTVTQNGKRYTIIDKENLIGEDEVTGEQVTLTTDNLIKEETQCIPIKFKMI